MADDRIKILLADDHPIFREGLARLLGSDSGLVVVAQATDGDEALALIAELEPDIAILDMRMPGRSGVEVVAALRADGRTTPVLILSGSEHLESLYAVLAAGANGYLLKTVDPEVVRDAVGTVAAGGIVFSPELHASLALEIRSREAADRPLLTEREHEILRLTAAGGSAADIAAQLFLSVPTVRTHLQTAYQKLGVSDRAAAVAQAFRQGLID